MSAAAQLDRIEAVQGMQTAVLATQTADLVALRADLRTVVDRVGHVERKASFWGAIGGVVALLASNLPGCL